MEIISSVDLNSASGSGTDSHNKGWFATPAALRTAYPTATNGDWAIVGSTDTVWVWDSDTTDWKDTGTSGTVSYDGVTITANAANQLQTVGIIDQNSGYNKVWTGTAAEFSAITTKDSNTLYIVDGPGTTEALLGNYTLDGLSITSTNTDIKTLVQAVVAKNLPIGSIVTGSVQLTDAPADNMTDAMVEIVAYELTEGSSTDTIYDITLNSRHESPYQWHAEYWVNHSGADVGWSSAPLAFWNMPTASATYGASNPKVAQYVGPGDGVHVTGKFYRCQEVTPVTTPATYEWVMVDTEPIGSSSDFGIVKVDNSSIVANNGVITANKATGNYSTTFVGNPATTTSALNIGANSTAHGWYATAIGCDAVVGDSTNDVRVPGAIQLGRGSNTEAGTFKVGLSTDGSNWNNYKLIGSDGKIPATMLGLNQITGYDSTKTQVLKNVQGTLIWVDEA